MKTVVVLGAARSGTSLVAGILHSLGVKMGDNFQQETFSNPFGYYENILFVELNRRILKEGEVYIRPEDIDEEIRKLVGNQGSGTWGWKDPRTCFTIDRYFPHLVNPYFIITHRNQLNIIRSLQRRKSMTDEEATKEITTSRTAIHDFLSKHPQLPRLDVSYEDFYTSPDKTIQLIVDFLEVKPTEEQIKKALLLIKTPENIVRARLKFNR